MTTEISIHALREEGDVAEVDRQHRHREFQSTPSARRATEVLVQKLAAYEFQSTPSARRATMHLPRGRGCL